MKSYYWVKIFSKYILATPLGEAEQKGWKWGENPGYCLREMANLLKKQLAFIVSVNTDLKLLAFVSFEWKGII